jgi:hypothetical protein
LLPVHPAFGCEALVQCGGVERSAGGWHGSVRSRSTPRARSPRRDRGRARSDSYAYSA